MAVAAVTSQLTDNLLNPGSPTSLGSANAQSSETTIQRRGTSCAAIGHSGSLGFTNPTSINQFRGMYSTPPASLSRISRHLHLWIKDYYPVRNKNIGGISVYISDGSNAALYYVSGLDDGYDNRWLHYVINLDATTRAASDLGSLPTGNISRIGYCGNISATKGESFLQNCYLDTIRSGTTGQGLTFSGGAVGDRLTLSDCAQADSDLYGLLRTDLTIEGPITFGGAGLTIYLQDSIKTLKFRNFTTGDGVTSTLSSDYYSINFVTGTVNITEVSNCVMPGVSRLTPYSYDTTGLASGDSHDWPGLTHIFASNVNYGPETTALNHTFIETVNITPEGIPLTNPTFSNSDRINLTFSGASLVGGITTKHNTAALTGYILTDDLSKVGGHSSDNTGGTGHMVELNSLGSGSMVWNGVDTGYAVTDGNTGNETIFVNVASGTLTINVGALASTPTIRTAGATVTVVSGSVTLTIQANVSLAGAEVRIYDQDNMPSGSLGTELDGVESNLTASFSYSGAAANVIWIQILKVGFEEFGQQVTMPVNDSNFNAVLIIDDNQ